jgi:hypothetical protein
MKTIINLALICAFTFVFSTPVQAQKTVKEMDKKTKSELKEYIKNPSSFRKMIANYKEQLDGYELQVTELQEDYYKADYLRVIYYDSIGVLNEMLASKSGATNGGLQNLKATGTGTNMYENTGTDFRVQVGAYRYFDFTQLLQFNQPIGFEKVNGVIHYYLGSWGNADEAYEFAQAIRKLKIKDAFVSKYVDGERSSYDHLMESTGTAYNK